MRTGCCASRGGSDGIDPRQVHQDRRRAQAVYDRLFELARRRGSPHRRAGTYQQDRGSGRHHADVRRGGRARHRPDDGDADGRRWHRRRRLCYHLAGLDHHHPAQGGWHPDHDHGGGGGMTRLFKNNVTSELAVGIDAAATEIQILDPSSFPATIPGSQYLRQAGSWQAVKGGAGITADPPANPMPGQLWWESDSGALNIWYIDANTSQWVQTNANGLPDASADGNTYARKNNAWVLSVTSQDVTTAVSAKVAKAGDIMTGGLQVGV